MGKIKEGLVIKKDLFGVISDKIDDFQCNMGGIHIFIHFFTRFFKTKI